MNTSISRFAFVGLAFAVSTSAIAAVERSDTAQVRVCPRRLVSPLEISSSLGFNSGFAPIISRRIFNPTTGNFEEDQPFGARSNKGASEAKSK